MSIDTDRMYSDTRVLPDILNVKDLASLLNRSEQTIKRWILDEKIPGHRFGKGRYLISKKELVDFIEKRGLGHGNRGV